MKSPLFVTLLSGLVSALLFASPLTGSFLAILTTLFAPLPIVYTTFSFGPVRGLQAGLVGIVICGLLGSTIYFPATFMLTTVLPYVAYIHILHLSRTIEASPETGQQAYVEWYPVGRLLIWIAIVAASLATLFIVSIIGTDAKSYIETVNKFVDAIVKTMETSQNLKYEPEQIKQIKNIVYYNLPISLGISLQFQMLLNLWFGGRLAQNFGYLGRPWPSIKTIEYPNFFVILFAVSLTILVFFKGILSIIAITYVATFLLSGVIFGLIVIHTLVDRMDIRWPFLVLIYISLIVMFLPTAILLSIVGVGDPIFKLKERALKKNQSDNIDQD